MLTQRGLQQPHPEPLQQQRQKGRDDSDEHPRPQRDGAAAERVERRRAADHLDHVACQDRQLDDRPEQDAWKGRVARAAVLREVALRRDAQLGGQHLDDKAHAGGPQRHPAELIPGRQAQVDVRGHVACRIEGSAGSR